MVRFRLHPGTWALLALLLSLGQTGCMSGCDSKSSSTVKLTRQETAGKKLYQTRCAHCHEENDLGIVPEPPNLHDIADTKMFADGTTVTDAAIKKLVLAGKGKMPAFKGRFTDRQMNALIAYMKTGLQ